MITAVECVEYTGVRSAPGGVFADRLRRPVDVYPDLRAIGPQVFPPTDGPGEVIVTSIALHIRTDDGLVGTTMQISAESAFLINSMLRPLLIGADPMATEYLWDLAYRSSIHGRRGAGMVALSAVDCALWDLRGQLLGEPVHRLLGGPTRDRIPAYASTLGDSLQPSAVLERSRELVAQGFSGVKWFPRWGPEDGRDGVDRVVELVAAAREGAGPRAEIMLDAWCSWDVEFTVRVARECRALGLGWIEEPLLADNIDGYRALRRRMPAEVQIAGGEHEYTRWGYQELLRNAVLDVHQPDPHWAGGISETWKILALIAAAGGTAVFHGQSMQCNSALAFACSPALVPQQEYLARLMPLYQHFLADPVVPVEGHVPAPAGPGLGMTLDESAVRSRRIL